MNSVLFQMIVGVFVFLQSANGILVNTSMVLQQILCQNSCSSNSTIYLDSSVHYKLDAGRFCIVNCVESIFLSSNTNDTNAVISCSAERLDYQKTNTGIAFVNSRVVLQKITLINCGTYLKTLPEPIQSLFNSSVVRYRESYAAALLMVNCTVIVTNIVLISSFGFGLIGINIAQNDFQSLSQNGKTEFNNMHLGSGILLHYIDSTNSLQNYNRTVHLNSLISNHFLSLYPADYNTNYFECGRALTVIFAQTTFTVKVWVRDSIFHRIISGSLVGAVAIYQYNRHSSVSISTSLFEANVVYFQSLGASITLVLNDLADNLRTNFDNSLIIPLSISGCTFVNHNVHLLNNASLIYVNIKGNNLPSVEILIKDTACMGMHGTKYSGFLYAKAESSNTTIILEDISVLSNYIGAEWLTGSGLLVFDSISLVKILGQSIFNNNYGSVIKATDSVVVLQGFIEFTYNHAGCGAAIHITGKSHIYFAFTANVKFVNNSAVIFGGAIYSDTVSDMCPLCFDNLKYGVAYFINNTAGLSGKDIHSTRLFNCHMCNSNLHINSNSHSMIDFLTFLLRLRHPDESIDSLLSLSTKPSTLQLLNRDTIETKWVYPGQSIEIHLVALDACGRSVYSPVQIHLGCAPLIQPMLCDRSLWLLFVQREQLLQENKKFTKVTATIHTINKSINGAIMTKISCFILELNSVQSVTIFIHPCPWGFRLNPTSGICECSPLVKKFNSLKLLNSDDDALQPQLCSIVDQQFDSSIMETWAGVIVDENGQKTFAVSNNCPSGNCNIPASEYLSYYTNETGLYRATKQANSRSEHLPICAAHREGPLCGKCIQGYSIAFNSKKCEICHNRYLVPNILALLLYGPLLIAVLFTFTLTLSSGALNGIIFYANLTNIGLYDLISLPFTHNKPLQICISIATTFLEILNVNPVFPVCLFDGMNEMHKIIIKLLFQFYIWMIVLILMCVSRYSVWLTRRLGNSSIKVLMTVFHISVCRMLLTLIDVFSCTHVYFENGNTIEVWLVDGSITCYQSYHLVLSVCTLFVIGPLLLVYCTVLLFPSQMYKCRFGIKYCRPLIEAVLAPYRRGKEYWFTLRIAILIVLYSVYASFRGTNYLLIFYITLPILTILTMAQIYSQPLKNKLINLLDIITATNFTILVMLTWYYMLHEIVYTVVVVCVISVFINIFFLCLIILYRVAVILNRFSVIRKYVVLSVAATKQISFKWKRRQRSAAGLVDITDSFHQPCADYREPLLRSSDN